MDCPEGHTVWSWGVRRFHDWFNRSYFRLAVVVIVAALINVVFFEYGVRNEWWSKTVMTVCSNLVVAQAVTQIITANLIFHRCPLTLVEWVLRGEGEVKRYWAGRLQPGWSVAVLVGVTAALYLLSLWVFLLSGLTMFTS